MEEEIIKEERIHPAAMTTINLLTESGQAKGFKPRMEQSYQSWHSAVLYFLCVKVSLSEWLLTTLYACVKFY